MKSPQDTVRRQIVSHESGSYEIVFGTGVIGKVPVFLPPELLDARACIVGDRTVLKLYAAALSESLRSKSIPILPAFHFQPGERSKSLATLQRLLAHLTASGMTRNDLIVALGGGVTGDLAGFAAAVYMRGIRYIQIPTTLLAQADSSIGGKTGVNLPTGKNLVGAFHAPSLVICDPDTLDTLPLRHIRNGLAEIIKMAIIDSTDLFEYLEKHAETIVSPSGRSQLLQALKTACELKCETVEKDEKETGIRIRLNLGHTFAHGIECVAGYGELLHGEAVALGILTAARVSESLSICSPTVANRIENLLERIGLPVRLPHIDRQAILQAMTRDKKSRSGVLRLVLPEKIGSVLLMENPDLHLIDRILMERL